MSYWMPATEADLLLALESGTVEEGHHLEFKREIGSGESDRKETGRDLASLAINGGILVIGVDEPEQGKFTPAPVALAGLAERVEQIAANRAQPGLAIRARSIASTANPREGFLVIEVPPSPGAPHMVDGKYWARNEKTKRPMSDAEVVVMHSRREGVEERVVGLLAEVARAAPTPPPRARMYLAAHPIVAPQNAAASFVRRGHLPMVDFSMAGEPTVPRDLREWSPGWDYSSRAVTRMGGVARTTLADDPTANDQLAVRYGAEIEVRTSGDLLMLASPIWDQERAPWGSGESIEYIWDGMIVASAFRLVGLVRSLAIEIDYRGPWGFGLRIDGLHGLYAPPNPGRFSRDRQMLTASNYTRTATAHRVAIDDRPGGIVEQLLTDLLVNLGVINAWEGHFAKPEQTGAAASV